jgi:hypothetical protein
VVYNYGVKIMKMASFGVFGKVGKYSKWGRCGIATRVTQAVWAALWFPDKAAMASNP